MNFTKMKVKSKILFSFFPYYPALQRENGSVNQVIENLLA